MRALIALAVLLIAVPAFADVSGPARVVDGDTLWIGETKIGLYGIDAPELKQTCTTRKGKVQHCGRLSMQHLVRLVRGQDVSCKDKTQNSDGRLMAVCRLGPFNLNEQMVIDGWALADRQDGKNYQRAETFAKARREGIWRSTFDAPWDWRKTNR